MLAAVVVLATFVLAAFSDGFDGPATSERANCESFGAPNPSDRGVCQHCEASPTDA